MKPIMTSSRIKFVTDSVADLPPDLVKKWDITVVPCFVNYGGGSYADDGVELVREDYYRALGKMSEFPTTSAMPPDFARERIEPLLDEADHVVIVATPAKLSGIYNAMRLAVADFPQDRVTVIDSGMISIGMGFQVILGAEVAAETGDVQRTLRAIQAARDNIKVYAAIATMEFLRRSGRVNWATASIGALLQIKPLVEVHEGEVLPAARARTFNRALDKVAQLVREQGELERVGMLHINNPEGMDDLRQRLSDVMPANTIIGMICPAIGSHIGPGAVGIVTVKKGWKDAIGA
jgi:DegV family protein with EDD domain